MDIVAFLGEVFMLGVIVGYLIGTSFKPRSQPPPSRPDSADFKRGT